MSRRLLGRIVAATVVFLVPAIVIAQWAGGKIQINGIVPISGDVEVTNRVDVSATTPPGTWLAVAGDETGATLEVRIPGTVTLSNDTLAALNGRFCVPGGQAKEGVDGTVVGVPPIPGDGGTGAFPGRTSISIVYPLQSTAGFLSCFASGLDGGTDPDCTLPTAGNITQGFYVDEGGSADMEISDAYVLRCLHCTPGGAPSGSTVTVSYVEMDCNQP